MNIKYCAFLKIYQAAQIEPPAGRFWATGRRFGTADLDEHVYHNSDYTSLRSGALACCENHRTYHGGLPNSAHLV